MVACTRSGAWKVASRTDADRATLETRVSAEDEGADWQRYLSALVQSKPWQVRAVVRQIAAEKGYELA